VFAENNTLLVDHINGIIPASVISGTAGIDINSTGNSQFNQMSAVRLSVALATVEDLKIEGNITADDSSLIIDGTTKRLFGSFNGTLDGNINRTTSVSVTASGGILLSPSGILSVPNATTITVNASDDISIDATNTLLLRSTSGKVKIISNPPTTARGAMGDEAGMIAFDQISIFYCKTDYTNGSTPIWVKQTWGDTTDWT
jgi:hypothetical protein